MSEPEPNYIETEGMTDCVAQECESMADYTARVAACGCKIVRVSCLEGHISQIQVMMPDCARAAREQQEGHDEH